MKKRSKVTRQISRVAIQGRAGKGREDGRVGQGTELSREKARQENNTRNEERIACFLSCRGTGATHAFAHSPTYAHIHNIRNIHSIHSIRPHKGRNSLRV